MHTYSTPEYLEKVFVAEQAFLKDKAWIVTYLMHWSNCQNPFLWYTKAGRVCLERGVNHTRHSTINPVSIVVKELQPVEDQCMICNCHYANVAQYHTKSLKEMSYSVMYFGTFGPVRFHNHTFYEGKCLNTKPNITSFCGKIKPFIKWYKQSFTYSVEGYGTPVIMMKCHLKKSKKSYSDIGNASTTWNISEIKLW